MLTDYKMPKLNGLELTRAVRTFDNGETAIIMLTGYNWDIIEDEAKGRRGRDPGQAAFFGHPFT
jgi:CheY-like chemotaxis protein